MSDKKQLTPQQNEIVKEICTIHSLQPEQISFDGNEPTPIFDYEAVCFLTLKLTDIHDIECWITDRDPGTQISTAKCKVTLVDGRTRTSEDSAVFYEQLENGMVIDSIRKADSIAQNRAVRRGIRSVGINLFNAHRHYIATGKIATGHTDHDPRLSNYREIHVLAQEVGLIVDGDKTAYRAFIAESFEGIESSKDLNDIDLHRLLASLRAMSAHQRSQARKSA